MSTGELREKILSLVEEFAAAAHQPQVFEPGSSDVPVSGRVYSAKDIRYLVDASLDFWLTAGRFNDAFEKKLADFLGVKYVMTANSGSSANLLAVAALTSPMLESRALKPGDEVITVAACFPTSVNPLLFYGLIPVFVDVDIPTYNIQAEKIEDAITEKTRAIVLAHTLGNPFDLDKVMEVVKKHDLWLIEDCCDALGSRYHDRKVGTFGHIGTLSFYPAHHITMGEGGSVFTNDPQLKRIIESFRDWGRDCYCEPGKDNTCGKRFGWELGKLPKGYDHKYIFSHAGFNLKITDMQAAVGLAQMDHLPDFIDARKRNFRYLKERFSKLDQFFILPEPTMHSDPAWFGFPLTVRKNVALNRKDLVDYLNLHRVGTRQIFAGNVTKQPYFSNRTFRVSGSLENTNFIMENSIWLGVYPGLTEEMLGYMAMCVENFVSSLKQV